MIRSLLLPILAVEGDAISKRSHELCVRISNVACEFCPVYDFIRFKGSPKLDYGLGDVGEERGLGECKERRVECRCRRYPYFSCTRPQGILMEDLKDDPRMSGLGTGDEGVAKYERASLSERVLG
ncbi:hypothetical protein CPB86DRAFT_270863 [Serendipita vermifera]|nr:hypothetical protein CPB86DRAFT_270863 [Serendipita vermifera]